MERHVFKLSYPNSDRVTVGTSATGATSSSLLGLKPPPKRLGKDSAKLHYLSSVRVSSFAAAASRRRSNIEVWQVF